MSKLESHSQPASFMAVGVNHRQKPSPVPSLSGLPGVAQQEDNPHDDDDEYSSEDDMSTVSDPDWQFTSLYTVLQPPVQHSMCQTLRWDGMCRRFILSIFSMFLPRIW